MSRTFTNFPKSTVCPLCAINDDKECCLVPIDATGQNNICEAQPVHVECLHALQNFRYNKDAGVIYQFVKEV